MNRLPEITMMTRQETNGNLQATNATMSDAGTNTYRVVAVGATPDQSQTPNNNTTRSVVSQAPSSMATIIVPEGGVGVIVPGAVYPLHLFRYPDEEDYNLYLSNKRENKYLEQVLSALEGHMNVFRSNNSSPPTDLLNLTSSLFLAIKHVSKDPVYLPLIYLNAILHTSPFLKMHQFLFDAYFATGKVNCDVLTKYMVLDTTTAMKRFTTMVIGGMLRYEIEVKQSMDEHKQKRVPNQVVLQSVEASPVDPYEVLGIRKIEDGGHWMDWEDELKRNLAIKFSDMELGVDEDGEVFVLGYDSHEEMVDREVEKQG